MMKRLTLVLLIMLFTAGTAFGQMERERAQTDNTVEELFWAPNLIGTETVQQLPAGNLNVTVMHSFGIATDDALRNFFGLDFPPNVRLGLDYGLTDNWSMGIGRTTNNKVVDFRTKVALLKQKATEQPPLSISLKGDVAVRTDENLRPFSDDLSFFVSLPTARKFSDAFSLQITPMYAHFNAVFPSEVNDIIALGIGGEYRLSERYALTTEYYPVLGDRPANTKNAFALGLNIETGGHVFQLFFASSNWHTEQYILLNNRDDFWAGDFRFGFNVNRLFFL